MPMTEDHPRLVFVPEDQAIVPPSGIIECLKDRWWLVHPTKGLVFFDKRARSPQCNGNKTIAESFKEKMYPWADVKFIPVVFRRIDLREYCS